MHVERKLYGLPRRARSHWGVWLSSGSWSPWWFSQHLCCLLSSLSREFLRLPKTQRLFNHNLLLQMTLCEIGEMNFTFSPVRMWVPCFTWPKVPFPSGFPEKIKCLFSEFHKWKWTVLETLPNDLNRRTMRQIMERNYSRTKVVADKRRSRFQSLIGRLEVVALTNSLILNLPRI